MAIIDLLDPLNLLHTPIWPLPDEMGTVCGYMTNPQYQQALIEYQRKLDNHMMSKNKNSNKPVVDEKRP